MLGTLLRRQTISVVNIVKAFPGAPVSRLIRSLIAAGRFPDICGAEGASIFKMMPT
jgi:hypothetical protein